MMGARRERGRRAAAYALLAGVLVGGGCGTGRDGRVAAATARGGEPDALFSQIDATLTLAIEQSRLASSRASDADLRRFAAAQVARYGALRDDLRVMTHDLEARSPRVAAVALPRVRPPDALRAARGPQFDRAYVQQALEVHQRLLGALDLALQRARDDDELRRALLELRDSVPGHASTAVTRDVRGATAVAAGARGAARGPFRARLR